MLAYIQVLIEFPRFPQEIIQVVTIGSHNAKQFLIAYPYFLGSNNIITGWWLSHPSEKYESQGEGLPSGKLT